jgi:polyvinyl alcohol dehydrogenase (cytochrome)
LNYDAWNVACLHDAAGVGNCPSPEGPDYDFGGSGPNMLGSNLLGIGQKSGIYWALDPDNGSVVWQTQVGPAGILWGTAFDGASIYVPITNSEYTLLYPSARGRAGERRLVGGVGPEQRPDSLADRNARRMFAVGFRL